MVTYMSSITYVLYQMDTVNKDMRMLSLSEDMALNRGEQQQAVKPKKTAIEQGSNMQQVDDGN